MFLVTLLHPTSLTNLVKNYNMIQGSDCIPYDTEILLTAYLMHDLSFRLQLAVN